MTNPIRPPGDGEPIRESYLRNLTDNVNQLSEFGRGLPGTSHSGFRTQQRLTGDPLLEVRILFDTPPVTEQTPEQLSTNNAQVLVWDAGNGDWADVPNRTVYVIPKEAADTLSEGDQFTVRWDAQASAWVPVADKATQASVLYSALVNTTIPGAVTGNSSPQTVTLANTDGIFAGAVLAVEPGGNLGAQGANPEIATVISVSGSAISIVLSKNHAAGAPVYGALSTNIPLTTITASITAGSRTVTPASMDNISTGTWLGFSIGTNVGEVIQVTGTTGTTFTATFGSSHTGPVQVFLNLGPNKKGSAPFNYGNGLYPAVLYEYDGATDGYSSTGEGVWLASANAAPLIQFATSLSIANGGIQIYRADDGGEACDGNPLVVTDAPPTQGIVLGTYLQCSSSISSGTQTVPLTSIGLGSGNFLVAGSRWAVIGQEGTQELVQVTSVGATVGVTTSATITFAHNHTNTVYFVPIGTGNVGGSSQPWSTQVQLWSHEPNLSLVGGINPVVAPIANCYAVGSFNQLVNGYKFATIGGVGSDGTLLAELDDYNQNTPSLIYTLRLATTPVSVSSGATVTLEWLTASIPFLLSNSGQNLNILPFGWLYEGGSLAPFNDLQWKITLSVQWTGTSDTSSRVIGVTDLSGLLTPGAGPYTSGFAISEGAFFPTGAFVQTFAFWTKFFNGLEDGPFQFTATNNSAHTESIINAYLTIEPV